MHGLISNKMEKSYLMKKLFPERFYQPMIIQVQIKLRQ